MIATKIHFPLKPQKNYWILPIFMLKSIIIFQNMIKFESGFITGPVQF
jgi:hypothetical protein